MKQRPSEGAPKSNGYRWRSRPWCSGWWCSARPALAARAVELQLLDHGFLAKQGDDRSMRVVKIAAHRGAITDRSGEPLAVSTPVDSVWVNPQELNDNIDQLPKLAKALKEDQQSLARRITSNLDREFLYLVRHMPPDQAAHIKALGIPGVYLLREYRRYYPAGEVAGHVVGLHDHRRSRPGGARARLRPIAERRGRREARHPGSVRALRRERREHPRAAARAAISSPASICASSIWPTGS